MTLEEAINFLKGYLDEEVYTEKCRNAHKMAIKALEQEPCEDCVNRHTVLNTLFYKSDNNCEVVLNKELQDRIKALPSVTPKPKMGQWIYDKTIENWRCSECNKTPKIMGYVGTADFMAEHFRFCNHCGIKMKVSENNHRR